MCWKALGTEKLANDKQDRSITHTIVLKSIVLNYLAISG